MGTSTYPLRLSGMKAPSPPCRAAVKDGRHSGGAACSNASRPLLDGHEHGGTLNPFGLARIHSNTNTRRKRIDSRDGRYLPAFFLVCLRGEGSGPADARPARHEDRRFPRDKGIRAVPKDAHGTGWEAIANGPHGRDWNIKEIM